METTVLQERDGLQVVMELLLLLIRGPPHPHLWHLLNEATGELQQRSDNIIL
jgi:hypothetical protein